MEHCVSAFLKSQKEKTAINYIADGLYAISNMRSMELRLKDILEPKKERSAEDIISDFKQRLNGKA